MTLENHICLTRQVQIIDPYLFEGHYYSGVPEFIRRLVTRLTSRFNPTVSTLHKGSKDTVTCVIKRVESGVI